MKKIIFVPGMAGGKRDMYLIKKIMKDFEVIYFHYDVWLNDSFEKSAKKLDLFITNLNIKRNEKISIIGVSAGGIVVEYYIKFINKSKIEKIVTVCSPFKGTWIASVFFRKHKGVQELRKNSKFLKKLKNEKLIHKIREKTFWCFFDPIVPGISAKGKNPEHTFFFLHWVIQFWPPLIHKIKIFLEEK